MAFVAMPAIAPRSVQALRQLCAQHSCTLTAGFLAVWKVLLARYSGAEEVTVTMAAASARLDPRWEHMVGFCLNLVCIRTAVHAPTDRLGCAKGSQPGYGSFEDILKRVRKGLLEGLSHAEVRVRVRVRVRLGLEIG